ncbi:MAG: NAD(+)/NADH kinase [Lachnospiraceae bacterium]|jgi:NAD+ kinase|nr:NAD(+)/NADH kinase [Lachnospiraceae bacterium]
MKYFYLITNEVKDPEGFYTRKITAYLAAHGGKVVCTEHAASYPKLCKPDLAKPEVPDCILVLGGDGTLLRAARNLLNQDIPLLGINLGTLGYLAEVEIAAIEEALDKLLADRFTREERMMLEGQVRRQDMTEQNYALNDIVISRCGSLQVLTFQIYVNGQFLNSYSADGMIVATPTGSTGYNMSAGGPIVEPGASLLLLTPICPHTLNTRSIVLAPDDEIRIEIPRGKDGQRQTVEASYDGSHKVRLQTDDSIVIRRADKTTGILKLNTESFLTVLHKKMSE